MPTVIIVDQDKHLVEELRRILKAISGFEICGVYTDGFSALETLKTSVPNIMLVNVLLLGMSGIGLAMKVRQLYPDIRIVLMADKPGLALDGFDMGVSGVVIKPLSEMGVRKALMKLNMTG